MEFHVGDRIKYKTNGGWYNHGTIEDADESSYLVNVDETGNYMRILNGYEILREEVD